MNDDDNLDQSERDDRTAIVVDMVSGMLAVSVATAAIVWLATFLSSPEVDQRAALVSATAAPSLPNRPRPISD